MDIGNLIIDDGNSTNHVNGVGEELPLLAAEDLSLDEANEAQRSEQLDGMLEGISQSEMNLAIQSSMGNIKDASIVHEESNTSNACQESTGKDPNHAENSKSQKGQGMTKDSATWAKKAKNENQQAVKGSASVDSGRPARSTSAPTSVSNLKVKKSGKSGTASFAANNSQPESVKELAKDRKPLKQRTATENCLSASLRPTVAGSKTQRIGATTSSSFSFRCGERAEKRKEFYSKLEEKIHAKELEKTNMQAKSKETQEAEIKLLRKSLTFKAMPMPSFYQESAPPKVELKKIPVTRPKSPKLGRNKSLPAPGTEGYGSCSSQSGRLSLDNKASHNSLSKESPEHAKKSLRKSVLKLPSQKSSGTNPSDGSPSRRVSRPQTLDDPEKALDAEQRQTDADRDWSLSTEDQLKSADQETVNEAEPPISVEQH